MRSLLVGANGCYTDRLWPERTWELLSRLRPTELRVTSFIGPITLGALLAAFPDAMIHVRPRTGNSHQGTWPRDILDYRSWDSERSLRDCLDTITGAGRTAYLALGNECDIEMAREPVDDWSNIREATARYVDWFHRERNQILEAYAYGDRVQIAVTSLSQGAPERFRLWKQRLEDGGCYAVADWVDEHLYSDGRPLDDPDWFGRRAVWADLGLPIDVTELNDNGAFATSDPHERAAHYAEMVQTLQGDPTIRSVSLFTLPGAPDDGSKPNWWFLTPAIVDAVGSCFSTTNEDEKEEPLPEPVPEPESMPTLDPYEHFTAEQIAAASECPIAAVRSHWPRLVAALDACGINDRATQIAALGTIAIETASTFEPVCEAYWLGEDWRRANLRYYPFFGRGFVQLTWASNYAAYSAAINALWGAGDAVDLIARPDDALDPDIAAAALALYFRDHGGASSCLIPEAARRGDWREVRRLVQGGSDGLDRLVAIASALGEEQVAPNPAPEPEPVPTIVYDADAQTQLQLQSWTCSVRSAMWCLSSVGVYLTPADAQGDMVGHGEVTGESGLLDARGYGLAAFLSRHLPPGLTPEVLEAPTWQDIRDRAGRGPIALGGRGWNHWSAVRRSPEDDSLELANPAPGWMGVGQRLHEADWSRLGPWSAVFVEVAPAEIPGQEVDELSAAERAELDDLRQKTPGLVVALADVADRIGDQLAAASVPKAKRLKLVKEIRGIREQFLGRRPA